MDDSLQQLFQALSHRTGFEVVNQTVTDNQIRVIHRIPKEGMPNWLEVMESLLDAAAAGTWNIDLSKQYFKPTNQVIYGWRMIIQAPNVVEHLPAVIQAVQSAKRSQIKTIIDEQPLVGASASRRGLSPKGKGVRPIAEGAGSYAGPR